MRKQIRVRVFEAEVQHHEGLYRKILQIYPGDPNNCGAFLANLDGEAPEAEKLLAVFTSYGMTKWVDRSRSPLPNEFEFKMEAKFDREDFEKAPLLMWFPEEYVGEVCETDESGVVHFNTSEFDMGEVAPKTRGALFSGKLHLAKALTDSLVSDGFRKIIEESGLVGCTFEREVVFVGDQAGRIPQKYWVIGTNVVLPPLSRRTVWEDAEGRRVAGPEVPGASIPTGEIYRYDEASLAPLGEFDNAMMLESDPKEPAMVMSQRFYQLCRKHKIRLVLEPVGVVKN